MADGLQLNKIAKAAKWSELANSINQNFELLKLALLAKYDGGKIVVSNEDSLPNAADASLNTLYIYPNESHSQYTTVISNGTRWVTLLVNNGDINELSTIKSDLDDINDRMDIVVYDIDDVSERFDLIKRNFDLIRIDVSNSMNELASIGDKVKGVSLNKGESNKKYLVITDKNGNVLTNECLENSLSITNEENRAKLSMLDANGNVLSFVYLPTSSGSGESGMELSVSDIINAAINQGWI